MKIDPALYSLYSKEKIDEAINLLSYHDAPDLPKLESPNLPTIFIFRHGQSEDNKDFIFSGWRDSPLTQIGIEQALKLSEKLRNKKIDMLISSPQSRAIDTMKYAISKNEKAQELKIQIDNRIKERGYGDLQGKSKLTVQLENPELLHKIRRTFDYCPKHGESISMVCVRVADFCNSIIQTMKKYRINVAVSCHGNSIRGFRRFFENLSDEQTAAIETPLGQDYAAYSIELD